MLYLLGSLSKCLPKHTLLPESLMQAFTLHPGGFRKPKSGCVWLPYSSLKHILSQVTFCSVVVADSRKNRRFGTRAEFEPQICAPWVAWLLLCYLFGLCFSAVIPLTDLHLCGYAACWMPFPSSRQPHTSALLWVASPHLGYSICLVPTTAPWYLHCLGCFIWLLLLFIVLDFISQLLPPQAAHVWTGLSLIYSSLQFLPSFSCTGNFLDFLKASLGTTIICSSHNLIYP